MRFWRASEGEQLVASQLARITIMIRPLMISHSDQLTLTLFLLTYAGIAVGHVASFKINRTGIALLGAIILVASGQISPQQALLSVNFPTLILLYGLMILSGQFWLSGFYTWVAQKISIELEHPRRFLLILMLVSGLLSAFLINDVVCLAFTPVVTLTVLKKRLNPLPFLLGLALSANIGAAATPIGNPQNILVATEANLHFASYLLWCAPPVLFSLLLAFGVIAVLGKKDLKSVQPPPPSTEIFPPLDVYQTVKGLVLLGIVVVLFFTPLPRGMVMISAAGLLLLSHQIYSNQLLAKVDYSILTLFIGLFIVVGAFKNTAFPGEFLSWLNHRGVDLHNPYLLSIITAVLSNLMSNAAAVMLLARNLTLDNSTTAYVLCLSNSFAGNLLIIGSIANLIVVEQAGSRGVKIGLRAFLRYGLPTTLASFVVLWGWIWLRS